jgi:Tfp pilus assembly protein PilN
MQTIHGIIPTDDGQYLMVSLGNAKTGEPRIGVKKWNCHDRVRTTLLLHRGVVVGLPSFWKSEKSRVPDNSLLAEDACKFFTPCTSRATGDIHWETLAGNCIASVPDDAFLCTIPLYMGDQSINSFVSVFPLPAHNKIGIVVDKELVAVFDMAPCLPDALEAQIGRIRQYCKRTRPLLPFPEYIYALGKENAFKNAHFSIHPLTTIVGNHDCTSYEEIRALGAALVHSVGIVPKFSGPSAKSSVRMPRTMLYAASVLSVLVAFIVTGVPLIADKITEIKIHAYESRFRSAILNDKEIKDLLAENEAAAKAILQFRDKSSARTNWAPFLHALGTQRPEGLYFEMLGSEPVKSSPGSLRIAVSGWARNEKLVADFIAHLQKDRHISNISLSSLEKNEKKTDICDFKILCILKTNI